ncbi:MAG: peptide-methionine (S)-S-oxide reductase MsrA [Acidobacteria bacterium]|nr:peptide-methionine (S)-S-oxide reductase MsrA [Acidobacteriota bacterium]
MNRYTAFALALALAVGAATLTPAGAQTGTKPATATAIFAAGCFWCVEEAFDRVDGVLTTTSGYTGGRTERPSYEDVSSGGTGHTEALQVTYDPSKVSYEALLQTFWHNVDPLDAGGQFCDRGSQYRSGVYYQSEEQQRLAEASKAKVAAQLGKAVVTEVVAAGPFYAAEDYHQGYYDKNPVRYKFYKWNCGRAQRLDELWGKKR